MHNLSLDCSLIVLMFFNLRSFIAKHSYKVDFISTVQVIISFIYIHFGTVIRHARHSFDFFSAHSVFLSAERPAMKRAELPHVMT